MALALITEIVAGALVSFSALREAETTISCPSTPAGSNRKSSVVSSPARTVTVWLSSAYPMNVTISVCCPAGSDIR